MARKKYSFEESDYSSISKPEKFVEIDGRMITSEKMYVEDNKSSTIIGVAMAGEIVRILEQSIDPEKHMTKIRTSVTNRTGYVNPNSVL